ncbi:MAG: GGDEF domain-containing protein [Acidobacteriota bacterium]
MSYLARTVSPRSSRWGVAVLVVVFLAVIASLVYVGSVGLEVLASVRAFVGGEGLWSKAEKDSVSALSRYVASGDEAHYREFQSLLAVPLGDRAAREALEQEPPDFAKAREGFLKGRNHPSDVDGMSRLFFRFRRFEHLARAISIWERGDTLIARLARLGEDAHLRVSTGALTADERAALLREVERVNGEVTPLEDAFSATLGEAARWVRDVLQRTMLALTILLVALALAAAYRIGSFLHLLEGSLRISALHDPLTGLPNRVLFSDRLALAIRHAERQGQPLAVMFLDLDDFKKINDNLGHAAGDEVLVRVAGRIQACLRGDDTVARVGGDEFVFLVPGAVRHADVASLAEKILALLSESLLVKGHSLRLTASLGIGFYPDDGTDAETLVANVDVAMYRAKDGGGNTFRFFDNDRHGAETIVTEMNSRA